MEHSWARALTVGLVVITSGLGIGGCEKETADHQAIRDAWHGIRAASESSNGEGAARLFSAGTFDLYDRIRRLGLDGTRPQVEAGGPMVMFEVMLMRHRATRKDLENLDGRGYVVYATGHGWYVYDQPDTSELRSIKIGEGMARAGVWEDGENTGYEAVFLQEDGAWKLDEQSLHTMWDGWIAGWAREAGMSLEEFLIWEEEERSGEAVQRSIWEPMK